MQFTSNFTFFCQLPNELPLNGNTITFCLLPTFPVHNVGCEMSLYEMPRCEMSDAKWRGAKCVIVSDFHYGLMGQPCWEALGRIPWGGRPAELLTFRREAVRTGNAGTLSTYLFNFCYVSTCYTLYVCVIRYRFHIHKGFECLNSSLILR